MFQFPTQPCSALKVLMSAIVLYTKTFSKMWQLFLFYCLTTAYWACGYTFAIIPKKIQYAAESHLPRSLMAFFIVGFFISLVALYAKWTSMHRIYQLATQSQIDLKESLLFIKRKCIVLFTNQILVTLATIIFFASFIIPGILLGIFLLLCIPLILFEEAGIFSSIKQSCSLVWGNFWHTFFVTLIPIVGMIPINILLNYTSQSTLSIKLLGIAGTGIIDGFILTPIFWTAILLLFHELKARKKNQD
jgi:hypothetical protein